MNYTIESFNNWNSWFCFDYDTILARDKNYIPLCLYNTYYQYSFPTLQTESMIHSLHWRVGPTFSSLSNTLFWKQTSLYIIKPRISKSSHCVHTFSTALPLRL